MGGQKAAHWSAYDFSPIVLSPPRKRLRSEAPLVQQLQNASSSNPDDRRRVRALEGLSLNEDDSNIEHLERPRLPKPLHSDGQPQTMEGVRSYPIAPDEARSTGRVPGIGDILSNFKPPQTPRRFKQEPSDEGNARMWFLREDSVRRPKVDEQTHDSSVSRDPSTAPRIRQHKRASINDRRKKRVEGSTSGQQENVIVDLTEDDSVTDSRSNTIQIRQPGPPLNWASASPQVFHQAQVPGAALQRIKQQYRTENIILPTNIQTWHQLEDFAHQNKGPSVITPTYVVQMRNLYAASVPQTQKPTSSQRQSLSSLNRNNQNPPYLQTTSRNAGSQHPIPHNHNHVPRASAPRVKVEPEERNQLWPPSPRLVSANSSIPSETFRKKVNLPRMSTDVPRHHSSDQATTFNVQNSSLEATLDPAAVEILMRPCNDLPDLLPATAPPDHPHLVALWHRDLLEKVPKTSYDHLSLIDTVVSIIAGYDLKGQSAIKAFLNNEDVPHFFFLFKSRTSNRHSWSVEREANIVTIGLERNHRAPNNFDSERPSSGQFDITIQYKLHEHAPITTTRPAASTTTTDANLDRHVDIPEGLHHAAARPTKTISNAKDGVQPSDLEQVATAAKIPHTTRPLTSTKLPSKWTIHATTIFPLSPDLHTFLWDTPPNRGADEIASYHHPSQTAILPAKNLSMLARYLQHTAFTCTAIEAEFQVAWGRRVRYDAQLGRVRATWEYALRGARTQAEKRRRGEYNRFPAPKAADIASDGSIVAATATETGTGTGATIPESQAKKDGREERPGAGESLDWLAGKDAPGPSNPREVGPEDRNASRSTRRVTRSPRSPGSRSVNTAVASSGTGADNQDQGSVTVKRETLDLAAAEDQQGGIDGESASEYKDSGDSGEEY